MAELSTLQWRLIERNREKEETAWNERERVHTASRRTTFYKVQSTDKEEYSSVSVITVTSFRNQVAYSSVVKDR